MDHQSLSERLAIRTHGRTGALALVSPGSTTFAHHDCSPDAEFEIGSISKGVTGLLYHVGLERAEVDPGTRLDELLPLAGCPAGGVVLADLATHRSGLPRVLGTHLLRRTLDHYRHGTNPYPEGLDELYEAARHVQLRPGRPAYSNAGFQLLGHALGAAAGVAYADLVRTRIGRATATLAPLHVLELRRSLSRHAETVTGHAGRRRVGTPGWVHRHRATAGGIRASARSAGRSGGATWLAGTAAGGLPRSTRSPTSPGPRCGSARLVDHRPPPRWPAPLAQRQHRWFPQLARTSPRPGTGGRGPRRIHPPDGRPGSGDAAGRTGRVRTQERPDPVFGARLATAVI